MVTSRPAHQFEKRYLLASAQAEKLRNKFLKIGALANVSVRHIDFRLSSGFPRKRLLVLALERLARPSG